MILPRLSELIFFGCLFQIRAIRVIRSNPNQPVEKDGIATIQNSSVAQFTLCARILTYQFDSYFSKYQAILTASTIRFLWTLSTKADCGFTGCREYYKDTIGGEWKYGKTYGVMIRCKLWIHFLPSMETK